MSDKLRLMKPTPPSDMWERMDAIHQKLGAHDPSGGFTIPQYAERYALQIPTAAGRLKRMVADGIVKRIGKRRINGRWFSVYDFA